MQWLQQNRKLSAGVAGGFFAASVLVVLLTSGSGEPTRRVRTKQWAYDLNTKTLFPIDMDKARVPPFDAPSGKPATDGRPAGVLAYVFSCGDCNDPEKRFIGYLETYAAGGAALAQQGERSAGKFLMIRRESDSEWTPRGTERGMRLISEVPGRCAGAAIITCNPD